MKKEKLDISKMLIKILFIIYTIMFIYLIIELILSVISGTILEPSVLIIPILLVLPYVLLYLYKKYNNKVLLIISIVSAIIMLLWGCWPMIKDNIDTHKEPVSHYNENNK